MPTIDEMRTPDVLRQIARQIIEPGTIGLVAVFRLADAWEADRTALDSALEQLEEARKGMSRIVTYSGIVGDYDGAYDWVRKEDYDKPEYAVGEHEADWPGEGYTVREVLPPSPAPEVTAEDK